jgi:SAM-dependent methyltransferase
VSQHRTAHSDAIENERSFWDEEVPSLETCLEEYLRGPDPNTQAMIDALKPVAGKKLLDFACGGGVTSAWLAASGARVTGIDISPKSIERARELCFTLGLDAEFVVGELHQLPEQQLGFDRIAGRYALHHVDIATICPGLASLLVPAGTAAFLETTVLNPALRLARKHLVGRFGIRRLGTLDEHPLTREDLGLLTATFGRIELVVSELTFFSILDRQLFGYRYPPVTQMLNWIDGRLHRLGMTSLSYHQVVVLKHADVKRNQ